MPHTSAPRGKRVWVVLKDGTKFIDRFMECTKKYILFADRGRVFKGDVRAFSIRQIFKVQP